MNNGPGAAPDARKVSGALLSPLFIGSVYFFFREVTQMISVRQQTTVLKYLTEPENMLNLSFVFLNMYYTILMSTGAGDDNSSNETMHPDQMRLRLITSEQWRHVH